jgi:hypothetical protein
MSIEELNQHPLNQAALRRLRAERLAGDQHTAPLLTLALAGVEEGQEDREEAMTVAAYLFSPGAQSRAVEILADDLEPEDVATLALSDLLDTAFHLLRRQPPRD